MTDFQWDSLRALAGFLTAEVDSDGSSGRVKRKHSWDGEEHHEPDSECSSDASDEERPSAKLCRSARNPFLRSSVAETCHSAKHNRVVHQQRVHGVCKSAELPRLRDPDPWLHDTMPRMDSQRCAGCHSAGRDSHHEFGREPASSILLLSSYSRSSSGGSGCSGGSGSSDSSRSSSPECVPNSLCSDSFGFSRSSHSDSQHGSFELSESSTAHLGHYSPMERPPPEQCGQEPGLNLDALAAEVPPFLGAPPPYL